MLKRKLSTSLDADERRKRRRIERDDLSLLSDELILRILSHLPTSTIAVCQRLSRKFRKVASDNQLWKAAYFDRFVRPRLRSSPRFRNHTFDNAQRQKLSGAWSRRLNDEAHERTLKHGEEVDWKKQYKIRHNWSKGICGVSEIPVSGHPQVPNTLARLHDSVIYIVDFKAGLRAFSYRKEQRQLAHINLHNPTSAGKDAEPSCITVTTHPSSSRDATIMVGFRDGSFAIFSYRTSKPAFERLHCHPASCNGAVTALTLAWPYALTMSTKQILSLYQFGTEKSDPNTSSAPKLLSSLRSQTAWSPLSLALRLRPKQIIASVAYCVPTFNSGWSVGVQELFLDTEGGIVNSRLTSAVEQGFVPLSQSLPWTQTGSGSGSMNTFSTNNAKPLSLSYSHPYLLASHPDNTLSVYLVTSNEASLSISSGTKLHGHTSSVFGAHVEQRGKAVSVSLRGNEVRVWELEGVGRRNTVSHDNESSVRLTPAKRQTTDDLDVLSEAISRRGSGLGLTPERMVGHIGVTRGWVGFDEENVVVLREGARGSQALTVYDFS